MVIGPGIGSRRIDSSESRVIFTVCTVELEYSHLYVANHSFPRLAMSAPASVPDPRRRYSNRRVRARAASGPASRRGLNFRSSHADTRTEPSSSEDSIVKLFSAAPTGDLS